VFIKITRLDGTADLYGPASQTAFDETGRPPAPSRRAFLPSRSPKGGRILSRPRAQVRSPDSWIVEVEGRSGRHFLDHIVR